MAGQQEGTLSISIDLPQEDPLTRVHRQNAESLLRLLQDLEIAATWSVPSPNHEFVDAILSQNARHEIALLSPATTERLTRRESAQHLLRARIAAAQRGIQVSTFSLKSGDLNDRLGLLVKHQFSMIRGPLEQPVGTSVSASAQNIRYGVWQTPVSQVLQIDDRSRFFGAAAKTIRAMRGIPHRNSSLHLAIEITAVGPAVVRVLRRAAQLQIDGLRCLTLQEISQQLQQRGQSRRHHGSVLRAA